MSAKHSKKGANKPAAAAAPAHVAEPVPNISSAGAAALTAPASSDAAPSWIDSADPKKRMWGKIIFVGIWIYVGALWLLALDQTFHWGIFGPKVVPLP